MRLALVSIFMLALPQMVRTEKCSAPLIPPQTAGITGLHDHEYECTMKSFAAACSASGNPIKLWYTRDVWASDEIVACARLTVEAAKRGESGISCGPCVKLPEVHKPRPVGHGATSREEGCDPAVPGCLPECGAANCATTAGTPCGVDADCCLPLYCDQTLLCQVP